MNVMNNKLILLIIITMCNIICMFISLPIVMVFIILLGVSIYIIIYIIADRLISKYSLSKWLSAQYLLVIVNSIFLGSYTLLIIR